MKNFLIKNKILILSIILGIAFLIGCYSFTIIDQPETADPNSSFDVPITVALTPTNEGGEGYFGVRLPTGWIVDDSISFVGVMNGTFVYSSSYSDSMETYENSPPGYYWWVSVCDTVDSLLDGIISFTPRITTDNQTGRFIIDYMISGYIDYFSHYVVHGGPYPISVGLPMVATVTNTNNDGSGSLRKALEDVSVAGEIKFDLSYPDTIALDSSLNINHNVTITGPDAGELTILGNNNFTVLEIEGAYHLSVNIYNLTVCNGRQGINCYESNLNLTNVKVMNNYSTGISCDRSNLDLTNVTIAHNSCVYGSGGIACSDANLNLNNVKIMNNSGKNGGGIFISRSILGLSNVIIAHNSASDFGGGMFFSGFNHMVFDSLERCKLNIGSWIKWIGVVLS